MKKLEILRQSKQGHGDDDAAGRPRTGIASSSDDLASPQDAMYVSCTTDLALQSNMMVLQPSGPAQ